MKRNPQDSTLRNVRAATARIAKLETLVLRLAAENHVLKGRFNNIEQAFYEFFTGIEASQRAAASFKPRKGRTR